MDRFVPGFRGLRQGIEVIMFGKQSVLPCANFYTSVWHFFLLKRGLAKVIKSAMI